ncbi:MAG: S8 family serine peptidase [Bifidobacteriaceae bacterium]|nr:S8 family serine peptidase [Bifidobacteriaceae bacterium]
MRKIVGYANITVEHAVKATVAFFVLVALVLAGVVGTTGSMQGLLATEREEVLSTKSADSADDEVGNLDNEKVHGEVYVPEQKVPEEVDESRIILFLSENVTSQMLKDKVREAEIDFDTKIVDRGLKYVHVYSVDKRKSEELLNFFNSQKVIKYADYDGFTANAALPYTATPNDAYYVKFASDYWALRGYPGSRFNETWENLGSALGDENTAPVAVIDTGYQTDIYDVGNIVKGGSRDPNPICDVYKNPETAGHGTFVASQISANTNNSFGTVGAAWDNKVFVYNATNSDCVFPDSYVIDAIYSATNSGAKVINMSISGAHYSVGYQDAINYAWNHGVITVAAAGNCGNTSEFNQKYGCGLDPAQYRYPASYDNVISVGSITSDAKHSGFSTFNDKIDITAPGSSIGGLTLSDEFTNMNGTSMSAPHVSAAIALIWRHNPALTNGEVVDILLKSANKSVFKRSTDATCKHVALAWCYGAGILDVKAATDLVFTPQSPVKYAVHFDSRGANAIKQQLITVNSLALMPKEPVRAKYRFEGWYITPTGGTKFNFQTKITKETTLYAHWSKISLTRDLYEHNADYKTRFKDIGNLSSNRQHAIQWMYRYGIAVGADKYNPANSVNRGAMAEFMHKLAGYENIAQKVPKINDISSLKKSRQLSIKWLASVKVTVIDKKHKYNPLNTVSRGAMAEFLYKLAGSPAYTPSKHEFSKIKDIESACSNPTRKKAIAWLVKNKISVLTKDGKFNPCNIVNRGSMAELVMKFYGVVN